MTVTSLHCHLVADPGRAEHIPKALKTFMWQRRDSQVTKKFMGSSERAELLILRIFGITNVLLSHSVVRKPPEQFHFLSMEATAVHFLALSLFLHPILGARRRAAITAGH